MFTTNITCQQDKLWLNQAGFTENDKTVKVFGNQLISMANLKILYFFYFFDVIFLTEHSLIKIF